MNRTTFSIGVVLSVLGIGYSSSALTQDAEQLLAEARDLAGSEWRTTVEFLCGPDPQPGNAAETAVMEPTQIFDNLYAFGRSGAVVYAITTTEGIILIDSGYPDQVESVLAPGLTALGFSADDVRYVIVAHGHRDHYGGSRHMQQEHGASIVLSAADWEFMEQYREGGPNDPPDRDIEVQDGQPIVLGDTEVTPIFVPGHTPGAIGVIFDVQDGDTTHTAAMFGGTILISSRISDEGLNQYIDSLDRFAEAAAEHGADVEIQNHPIIDDMSEKLVELANRGANDPHPFVVGEQAYQDFLGVISACTQVELARRSSN
ncbi:MAG: MBL fold metallo-hydrolase [Gammaproteobacteria bacterium]